MDREHGRSPLNPFEPLELSIPRIAYTVLHQRKQGVAEDQYLKTLFELTQQAAQRAREATEKVGAWREARLRDALVGMPQEAARRVRDLFAAVTPLPAVEDGLEFATLEAALPDGRLAKLAANGSEYLASLGFRTGEGEAPVHESVLLFTGSWNYDFIEHLVRDLMGIYEDPHLQHTKELGPVIFFTQNQVAVSGDAFRQGEQEWQPSIFFAKGPPRYDEFRAALEGAMGVAVERTGIKAASLWQRKLGMGNIFEWELRLRCAADPDRLARALQVIAEEAGVAATRVAERGRLLLHRRIG